MASAIRAGIGRIFAELRALHRMPLIVFALLFR
jgi:hypothetical protein